MDALKFKLNVENDMTDLGELHYFLKIEFVRYKGAHIITMSQIKYIEYVLK
jgi:hypothetical protein